MEITGQNLIFKFLEQLCVKHFVSLSVKLRATLWFKKSSLGLTISYCELKKGFFIDINN